jgi:hypothetical protein
MSTEAKTDHGKPTAEERPFAHLRATPQERARILAAVRPFDMEAWLRDAVPPTPEELADLEDFLREREEMRQYSLERERERLAELGE